MDRPSPSRGEGGIADATMVVVPNSLVGVGGNFDNSFPFNIGVFGLSSQRCQQVYAASQFAALAPGGEMITQVAFRPDSFGAPFSTTLSSIRIDLSTTSKAADGLSATFADNVGADNTIVFGDADGEPLRLSGAATGGPPRNFDILINLTTPFLYNPANGSLLLDVRKFSGGRTTQFDAEFTSGDSVSGRFTSGSGVNSPTEDGSVDATVGLVTRFTTTPAQVIPEPGMVRLLVVGAVGLAIAGENRETCGQNGCRGQETATHRGSGQGGCRGQETATHRGDRDTSRRGILTSSMFN